MNWCSTHSWARARQCRRRCTTAAGDLVACEIEPRWFDECCRLAERTVQQDDFIKPVRQQLPLALTPEEDAADSIGSFHVAIGAIGDRVKAGAAVPTTGYFERSSNRRSGR